MSVTLRVLYCEADTNTREMMSVIFQAGGFEAIYADNPADCLRLVKEQQFDAYILDDTTWCEQMKELDPSTPMIFFSGASYADDKKAAAAMQEVLDAIRKAITVVRGVYELLTFKLTNSAN